ncbi:hypothetical protein M501DRAFT_1011387 [Patellaria atrata CBS 101060]|uniref:UDENN FLCN/SMCR8-type domain-containing protein n=1 Tax=Patellaria atrata CBS 101060 TaxID=1346257 RepID=A0A9P4VMF7_9PEZI|nr:hypothetical protein M501DRAFT_1011387 [Patellaria atrata CBS 101060]
MDFIISLAHFCEIHGPTSILCTQAAPVTCATCRTPCDTPPSDDLAQSDGSCPPWDHSSSKYSSHGSLIAPFDTPPTSPRSPTGKHNPYFPAIPSEETMRRYSSISDLDNEGCENCTFLVPRYVSDRLPDGAPGSPTKAGRNGTPILRSRQAIQLRAPRNHPDDGCESDVDSSDLEASRLSRTMSSSASSLPDSASASTSSSPLYMPQPTHTHTLTYITTKQPASPSKYSLLRRAIIRTLSCEGLPPGASSGPMYFGDPVAGHTIAYIFRLTDPRARGKRRTYAFIAHGSRDTWRVGMAFTKVIKLFEAMASQIISMAENVLEREAASASAARIAPSLLSSTPPLSSSTNSMPCAISGAPRDRRTIPTPATSVTHTTPNSPTKRNPTSVSSFLCAKKVDPDGFPRVSRDVMRAKGLAEIVGKDDFFVDLHGSFVMLLNRLIKEFGG